MAFSIVFGTRIRSNKCKESTESLAIIVFFSVCFVPILYLIRYIAKKKKQKSIASISLYALVLYLLFLFVTWIAIQVYMFNIDLVCKDRIFNINSLANRLASNMDFTCYLDLQCLWFPYICFSSKHYTFDIKKIFDTTATSRVCSSPSCSSAGK